MPETDSLSTETRQGIERIGSADVVVGIATYNNKESIGEVARAGGGGAERQTLVAAGGDRKRRRRIEGWHSGPNPRDRRRQRSLRSGRLSRLPGTPSVGSVSGVPSGGEALRTILKYSEDLSAAVCAVLDADVRSVTPEWVDRLVDPVLNGGYDLAVPLYTRHKFDGAINSGILIPSSARCMEKNSLSRLRRVQSCRRRSRRPSPRAPTKPW